MHISGVAHGENPGLTESQTEGSANFVLFGSLLSQPWPKLVWLCTWLSAAINYRQRDQCASYVDS